MAFGLATLRAGAGGLREALAGMRPECLEDDGVARPVSLNGKDTWIIGPALSKFWAMRPAGTGWRRVAIYRTSYDC